MKDALERKLHELVCAGQLDLKTAQGKIASGWIEAYKKYVRTSPPAQIGHETRFEPTAGLRRKSTVYGLNARRAHLVIALSLVTYGHAL